MKFRSVAFFIVLSSVVSLFGGCNNSPNPTNTQSGSGELSGTVVAYGVSAPATVNPSGITVNLEGTSMQTTTDNQGAFAIDNIPAGVYNIVFSKPGFDSEIYPVHHMLGVGDDIIGDASLTQIPNDSVIIDSVIITYQTDSSARIDTNNNKRTLDTIAIAVVVRGHVLGTDGAGVVLVNASQDSTFQWNASGLSVQPGKSFMGLVGGQFNEGTFSKIHTLFIKAEVGGSVYFPPNGSGEYQHFSTTPTQGQITITRFTFP